MMLSPHDDPQASAEFRSADYSEELALSAESAVNAARQSFRQLRALLLECPLVVGRHRNEIADIAGDFLELAAQAPRIDL